MSVPAAESIINPKKTERCSWKIWVMGPSNFQLCLAATIAFGLVGIPLASCMTIPTINYDTGLVDIKIVDLQILPLDDTPNYHSDDSDLVKVTVNVTNNGVDYFLASDRMFKI
ncbi:MAG TPA: hypothetical protein VLF17_02070, partial [Candidatus Nitrosotenuis sp.]|nr:hypothetical protein [Candidatus Nitrosotenuis sp.]